MGLQGLVLAMLTLSLLAPAAAATGSCTSTLHGTICAGDYGSFDGCRSGETFESARTGVGVYSLVGLEVGGERRCHNVCFPGVGCYEGSWNGLHAGATLVVASAELGWGSSGSSCSISSGMYAPRVSEEHEVACPAGAPPALPWGDVLP
ncbi:MAG TPA: hypothetical protein VM582_01445 [Candidatus Thermoplasmatota archaeon]|nr:hypothetical protein [Candidatus Thermoplasmatota archaeon]